MRSQRQGQRPVGSPFPQLSQSFTVPPDSVVMAVLAQLTLKVSDVVDQGVETDVDSVNPGIQPGRQGVDLRREGTNLAPELSNIAS